jgi:glyoxylase-like metal-dependent hydrolase (beta-lactamase superfamily II)
VKQAHGLRSDPRLPAGVFVLERGWLSSNNVLLCGADSTAAIDSGYWTHAEQTVALVADAVGNRPLDSLVNTHLHSDHCGGNAALQARFPAIRTSIPPGLADAVRNWDPVALSFAPTGQHCPPFVADDLLVVGSIVRLGDLHWEVHAAPGHDPHSVILFEPVSQTLISADALWEHGFGVVFQELEGEQAFDQVAATLDLIERLDPAVVIPGHGAVFSDAAGALGRARSRLDAYRANPSRHAAHAAKVLMKFKLLELQQSRFDDFAQWAAGTRYFQLVHERWFSKHLAIDWISQLIDDLDRAGALVRRGDLVLNS